MNKSVSMFIGGVLVGVLLTAVVFSAILHNQRTSGGPQGQLVLKLGHGLGTGHPVHQAMELMKQRLEELSLGTVTIDIYPNPAEPEPNFL